MYKFVFLHVENLFSSQEAYTCSFTFPVACVSVRKMLIKFGVAQRTLFPYVRRERKRASSRYILLVFNTCSSWILLPILPFGLVACTCVLFHDVSRNSCMRKVAWLGWILQNQKSAGRLEPISAYCAPLAKKRKLTASKLELSGTNRRHTEVLGFQSPRGFLFWSFHSSHYRMRKVTS